jgi:AraC-like DNA-binding protein
MPLKRVIKWIKKFEKYFFYYKDGYFVLPYLTNTPQLMVESLKNMPFVSHDADHKVMYSKTPFTEGQLRYQEIEEGLWLIVSELEFKVNVHTKAVYDDYASDYYFLAFSIYDNPVTPKVDMRINNMELKNNSWAMYKPGIPIDAFHAKGTKGLFFNFSFNKKWIETNFLDKETSSKLLFQKILNAEPGYLTWDGLMTDAQPHALDIWKSLSGDRHQAFSKLKVKIQTLEILTIFFSKVYEEDKKPEVSKGVAVSNDEPALKIEQYLVQNLTDHFPGIDFLADKVNVSPSKLKVNFKKVFGQSVYQYFRTKQMELALVMLKEEQVQIKNVSSYFGYENASKFSLAFKKVHKILPSEVNRSR